MKIGFLLSAFNQEEFILDCLKDLVPFCRDNGHIISAVSVPFKEYKGKNIHYDDTTKILKRLLKDGDIHSVVDEPKYISECKARSLGLSMIKEHDCDFLFLIDSDEIFSHEDLTKIQAYVESSEFIDWWSISYKNFVGEGYLKEPFTPPRVFKIKTRNLTLSHFYFDNDIIYKDEHDLDINYKSLANKIIPESIAWVTHWTWLSTEKNKQKVQYQLEHFGHCSYKWEDGQIKLNDDFFYKNNVAKPNIIYEKD